MQAIEEIEHEGLIIEIHYDDSPESPREWDNLGTLFLPGDGRHITIDEGDDMAAYEDMESVEFHRHMNRKGVRVTLPVFCLEHGMVRYQTEDFRDPWDSGQAGIIYATADRIRETYGVKRITPKILENVKECLSSEVDTYSEWANGDVFGYEVKGDEGEVLDACWGFYGRDYVETEARAAAESEAKFLRSRGTFVLDGVA